VSRVRYAGFGEEKTYGTAVDATFHVDIASATLDVPSGSKIEYPGGLSRGRLYSRQGFYSPSGNVEFAFDVNNIAPILKWALGGYYFRSGAASVPNKHEIYAVDNFELPSFTTRIGKDMFEHVFSGCIIDSLSITVDNEYCIVSIDIASKKDENKAIKSVGDLLISEKYPLVFHEVTVSRSNNDFKTKVKKMTLTINNNANADSGKRIGEINPVNIPVGRREVNLDLDLFYEDITELTRFWNDTEDTITITFDGGSFEEIKITLPKVITAEVSTQPSGADEIVQTVKCHAYIDEKTLENPTSTTVVNTEIHVMISNQETEIKKPT